MNNGVVSPGTSKETSTPPIEGITLDDGRQVGLGIGEAVLWLNSLERFYNQVTPQNPLNDNPRAFYELVRWVITPDDEQELNETSAGILMRNGVLPIQDPSSPIFSELRALYGSTIKIDHDDPWARVSLTNPLAQ